MCLSHAKTLELLMGLNIHIYTGWFCFHPLAEAPPQAAKTWLGAPPPAGDLACMSSNTHEAEKRKRASLENILPSHLGSASYTPGTCPASSQGPTRLTRECGTSKKQPRPVMICYKIFTGVGLLHTGGGSVNVVVPCQNSGVVPGFKCTHIYTFACCLQGTRIHT